MDIEAEYSDHNRIRAFFFKIRFRIRIFGLFFQVSGASGRQVQGDCGHLNNFSFKYFFSSKFLALIDE
mgnify:CR=1 FL=1